MKKLILIILSLSAVALAGHAQKFITKTGHIKFYSDSPLEKIEAHNRQVKAGLDVATGDFQFIVLLKSFEFVKALMQEHFNENYLESDKFPNATFIGKVSNIKDFNTGKDGLYDATVEGKLTIHGITRQVKEKGSLEVKEGKITGKAKFNILLSDYSIKIPGAVTNNISKSIEITVDVILDILN
ncbi:MAG: YceI family protein [Bacteroidetes bacterium]|nr:YceI family protein [Bacteroidota bacterium]